MNIAEIKIEYQFLENEKDDGGIPVIIAAAGLSTRMNGISKQMMCISGIPMLARTMLAFERSRDISRIIVVAKENDINEIQLLAEKYMIHKLSDITTGGETRQHSVAMGLARLSSDERSVLIHDGARPLVTAKIIADVRAALTSGKPAVTCGVPVKDTIKRVDINGNVTETVARDGLMGIQTPQGADVSIYRDALEKAENLGVFTDDMSVLEAAGVPVSVVAGDYRNIKITTPEDVLTAEKYIAEDEAL